MSVPLFLNGGLAGHRRGLILQDAAGAEPCAAPPDGAGILIEFGEVFQAAAEQQAPLLEWARTPGRVLLLVPPFGSETCGRPVPWRAEPSSTEKRGGEGLAALLAAEVHYRLCGDLQTPALAGAAWAGGDLGVGLYRAHPAAGLFAVTTLPLWSLAVLDAGPELKAWLTALAGLAGQARPPVDPEPQPLRPDHYGFLVLLLSQTFADHVHLLAGLRDSAVFKIPAEQASTLLADLQARGLVVGVAPTPAAEALVMQSPYASYLRALREVNS